MNIYKLLPIAMLLACANSYGSYTGTMPKDIGTSTPLGSENPNVIDDVMRERGTVQVNLYRIRFVGTDTTLEARDSWIVGSSSTPFLITMPAASSCASASVTKPFVITNYSTGTITLNISVDGVGSPTVAGSQTMSLFTDGTNWYEIRSKNAYDSDYLGGVIAGGYARSGVNSDITSITGLTTYLPINQGGSGANTAAGAASAFGVGTEDSPTFTGVTATTGSTTTHTSTTITATTGNITNLSSTSGTFTGNLQVGSMSGLTAASGSITTITSTTGNIANVSATAGTFTGNLQVGSMSGVEDADIPNDITLTNITQITNRSHNDITGTGTYLHTDIDSHIDDTSDPHGASITQTNSTTTTGTVTTLHTTTGNITNLSTSTGTISTLYNTNLSGNAGTFTGNVQMSSATGFDYLKKWIVGSTVGTGNVNLAAGLGVMLTPTYSNGNGTITITASGTSSAGGWTYTGTQTVGIAGSEILPHGTVTLDSAYGLSGLLDIWIPDDITTTYDKAIGTSTIKPTQVAIGTSTLQGALNVVGTITATGFNGVVFSAVPGSASASQLPPISGLIGSATSEQLPTVLKLYGTTTQQAAGAYGQLYVQSGNTFLAGTYTTATMTNYTTPSGVVTQSSEHSAGIYNGWKAFDKILGDDRWVCDTGTNTGWLKYDSGTGTAYIVARYDIAIYADVNAPIAWQFRGSNDDSAWAVLDSQSGQAGWVSNVYKEYEISSGSQTAYRFYQLLITQGSTNVEISELRLLEPSELYTQYLTKYADPVNGNTAFEILTPGTASTAASYIYNNATTTVWGLGTNTAITGTASGAYAGWSNRPVRVLAVDIGSSIEIKDNVKTIKIKPDLLDAEGLAKQKYIADRKTTWIATNGESYTTVVNETGTGSVTVVDTDRMESDYNKYIELEWASDTNQDIYTETVQKQHEKGFWQMFNSVIPRSWNPKDNPCAEYEGFVVEEMPDVVKGEDGQSINIMSVVAYMSVVQQSLKADTIFALSTLKELITTGTVTQQNIDYCNDRLEVLNP